LFIASAALVAACSASETPSPERASAPLARCVPNQTVVCLCGLDDGVQTCNEDGTLSPCECEAKRPAPPPDVVDPPAPPAPDAGPSCGNGWVEQGEACDDGNNRDGDGCSATCVPDGAPSAGGSCPGQTVNLWRGSAFTLAGSTDSYTHSTGAKCWNATGPERIYALRPRESGVLTISASFAPNFDAVVSVRTDCSSQATEVMCEDTFSKPFERVLQVEKGKPLYLFVDGDDAAAKGAFAVHLELL
jgi:cysteine-rich repeat protein